MLEVFTHVFFLSSTNRLKTPFIECRASRWFTLWNSGTIQLAYSTKRAPIKPSCKISFAKEKIQILK